MRLNITLGNGGRIRTDDHVVLDSVEDLVISIKYAKIPSEELKDSREILFVRSGECESAYTVRDGEVTVPKELLAGNNAVFGFALYRNGVNMERWCSAPVAITHAESGIVLTDEYDRLSERIAALEQDVAYIKKIMTGYSIL